MDFIFVAFITTIIIAFITTIMRYIVEILEGTRLPTSGQIAIFIISLFAFGSAGITAICFIARLLL